MTMPQLFFENKNSQAKQAKNYVSPLGNLLQLSNIIYDGFLMVQRSLSSV